MAPTDGLHGFWLRDCMWCLADRNPDRVAKLDKIVLAEAALGCRAGPFQVCWLACRHPERKLHDRSGSRPCRSDHRSAAWKRRRSGTTCFSANRDFRIRSYANCVRVDRDRGKVDFPCLVAAIRTGYGTRTHPVADELMDCSGIGAHWLTDEVPVVEACVQIGCVQIPWAGNGNRVTTCTRWPRSWLRRTATRGFREESRNSPPPGPRRPATPARRRGCPQAVPAYGVQ